MKNRLLWKLFWVIAVGTVALFWGVDILSKHAELQMSFISKEHQQQISAYALEAERIYTNEGEQALADWLQYLQKSEQTWAAVTQAQVNPLAGSSLSQQFLDGFRLGRNIEWKIHLYFKDNPIIDMPFSDGSTHFLIQLPQRMRPGDFFPYANIALRIALPFVLLCLLSFVLYRYVMGPLEKLNRATRQFSDGKFDVRINDGSDLRNDELTSLAETFDQMAERTSYLISNQRQLLADLSHEVRTPLARIDMAVDFVEQGVNPQGALARLRYESNAMRELVEDTLTLVWLDNEKPCLKEETFDLVELIQVICDDARFEYSDNELLTELPERAELSQSSQRALGQALENIIRNALRHSLEEGQVLVSVQYNADECIVTVKDWGCGVPQHLLSDIFRPFFQVDASRLSPDSLEMSTRGKKRGGYGLGLALAQRQIAAVGGTVRAQNHFHSPSNSIAGLQIIVTLPTSSGKA